jgi:hypothetical protein
MDITGLGSQITIVASSTFPAGFTINQGADDADYFDVPTNAVGDKANGVNGNLLTWKKYTGLDVTLSLAPGGDDDKNMQILLDMNRAAAGKLSVNDVITLTITYPNGDQKIFLNGKLISGPPAKSVAAVGRFKTSTYVFAFEDCKGNY